MMNDELRKSSPTGPLQERTKELALRIIRLVDSLPSTPTGRVIGNQVLRSGTSVGANYRAACRARSKAEFRAKLGICIEEADETQYWLELLVEAGMVHERLLESLLNETDELIAMMVASVKKASEPKQDK